ncbi:MAG TPA: peptidase S8, partial [Roseiarcus sp.]|nr:peptidase S8 [Roseiarcus sp.]
MNPPEPPPSVTRRAGSGVPPANERRFLAGEVVVELAAGVPQQQVEALEQRQRIVALEQRLSLLSGTKLIRARIGDRRSVAAVVRALENDALVLAAQPNYRFVLQGESNAASPSGEGAPQYAPAKLRLPEAHQIATGANVLIAIIDSGVDTAHPELEGAVAAS